MKTGSFKTYTGPGRISIARYARGTAAGFRLYPKLAPGPWFKTASKPEYTALFFEQLERLDPKQTIAELVALAGEHEPVLMCWEVPPFTDSNWCHRRMVAEWLGGHGEDVPELEHAPPKPKLKVVTPQQVLALGTVGLEFEVDGEWHDVVAKDTGNPLSFANAGFAEKAIARLPVLVGGHQYDGRPVRVKA